MEIPKRHCHLAQHVTVDQFFFQAHLMPIKSDGLGGILTSAGGFSFSVTIPLVTDTITLCESYIVTGKIKKLFLSHSSAIPPYLATFLL